MATNSFKQSTLGIIIGNRDFFPDKLVAEARTEILEVFKKLNITPILLRRYRFETGWSGNICRSTKMCCTV